MKLPSKYICIDIETTDAEASKGDVIQIGAVVLNEDLSMGSEFMTFLKPTSDYRNLKAMDVNGISEEHLALSPDPNEALERFEEFCLKYDKRPLLAAWGTYFDVTFLRQYYKKIGRKWIFSYRCLDLKSIAIWEVSKRDKETAAGGVHTFLEILGLKFEGKPHDAIDDIKNTLKIIQNL